MGGVVAAVGVVAVLLFSALLGVRKTKPAAPPPGGGPAAGTGPPDVEEWWTPIDLAYQAAVSNCPDKTRELDELIAMGRRQIAAVGPDDDLETWQADMLFAIEEICEGLTVSVPARCQAMRAEAAARRAEIAGVRAEIQSTIAAGGDATELLVAAAAMKREADELDAAAARCESAFQAGS